jgi:hypothetical protein
MARDRTTKGERRAARRKRPAECRRDGIGTTARRLRDGWGTVRITPLDRYGRPSGPMLEQFGKVTVERKEREEFPLVAAAAAASNGPVRERALAQLRMAGADPDHYDVTAIAGGFEAWRRADAPPQEAV